MASNSLPAKVPLEAYLAAERGECEPHYEWEDGQLFIVEAQSIDHNRIARNLTIHLTRQMAYHGCEVFSEGAMVQAGPRIAYPDVFVVCHGVEQVYPDVVANPVLIVEVLSPSTEKFDRGEKFHRYQLIPSLRDYVLVSQDEFFIERYRRGTTDWSYQPYSNAAGEAQFTDQLLLSAHAIYRTVSWYAAK